jgi:hypothetical protein
MTPIAKGLIVASVQVAVVASLGAKLVYDRATKPRAWARTAPFDPDLPIRGRYVSLQLIVDARGVNESLTGAKRQAPTAVTLRPDNDRLIAESIPRVRNNESGALFVANDLHIRFIERRGEEFAVLDQPVAFFIPEHMKDPSLRAEGEELWVEVTIPRKGPPRPIQLGIKKGDGPITPLNHQ